MIKLIFTSLVCSVAACLVVQRFGSSWGLVDYPSVRSSHFRPTPKGGGIGIVISIFFSSFLWPSHTSLILIAVLLGIFSFFSDRFELSPLLRLIVHLLAALLFLLLFFKKNTPGLPLLFFYLLFITGTTNLYNFMDGINGLAAVTGIISFSGLAFFSSFVSPEPKITALSLAVCTACFGFLPFNLPKAMVFMGDTGSITLGFLFAAGVTAIADSVKDFIMLSIIILPFYIDGITTICERICRQENVLRPHRGHLYQVLVNQKGLPHWKVALSYGVLQLLICLTILLVWKYDMIFYITVASWLLLLFCLVKALKKPYKPRFCNSKICP